MRFDVLLDVVVGQLLERLAAGSRLFVAATCAFERSLGVVSRAQRSLRRPDSPCGILGNPPCTQTEAKEVAQALLSVSLAVVLLVAAIAEANGMVWLTGWFAHGNFVLPWGFLTILLYIPLALVDDRRRGSPPRLPRH